jgi:hypothetical protein
VLGHAGRIAVEPGRGDVDHVGSTSRFTGGAAGSTRSGLAPHWSPVSVLPPVPTIGAPRLRSSPEGSARGRGRRRTSK